MPLVEHLLLHEVRNHLANHDEFVQVLVGDLHLSVRVERESVLSELGMALLDVLRQLLSRLELLEARVDRTVGLLRLAVLLHLLSRDGPQLLYLLLFLDLLQVFLRSLEVAQLLQRNRLQREDLLVLVLELDDHFVFLHVLEDLVLQLLELQRLVLRQHSLELEVVLLLVQLLEHLVVEHVDLLPADSLLALVVLVDLQVEGPDEEEEFLLVDLQTHLFVIGNDDEDLRALDVRLLDVVHFDFQLLLELVEEHVDVVVLLELVLEAPERAHLEHLAGEEALGEVLVGFEEHVFPRHLRLLEGGLLEHLVFELLVEVVQVVGFLLANEVAHLLYYINLEKN